MGGLLLTAVIAAVMSTADSQLLLASAIATDDLPFIKRFAYAIGSQARVWLGRFLLLVVGVISAALSILHPESVFNMVAYAWGGMAAAFGPVTVMALYWRRFNFWGALAAMITGTLAASVWGYLSGGPGGIWEVQPATPGCLIAVSVAFVVTLVSPGPSQEIVELFDQVNPAESATKPRAAL